MSVSRRASFAAGIAAVRRERKKRGNNMAAGKDDILEIEEEGEGGMLDCNHIDVLPVVTSTSDQEIKQHVKPKPRIQPEIRPFTKESLEKINLRTANLIRDYGFLPKRRPNLEDGAELPGKYEPFPSDLLGRPVEEIDPFVYEKTFCVVSRRFQKPFISRFSASNALFIFPPWNCLRGVAIYVSVNQYFDYLVMMTILANCAFLAMTEPINEAELVFLGIYTFEAIIKMIAKGFILNNYTYLRNPWNWLDFIVILSGYLTSFVEMGNLAGLRTFRVLRALKTVSIMPGLKTIINALLHSVKQLAEVMTLTIFCLMVFALFALQVYMGQLRNKCVLDVPESANWSLWVNDEANWFKVEGNPELCGNASGARSCPHGYTCLGSIGGNPNFGYTSFDNLLWSMLTTFQLITLDYWENVYNMVVATGGPIHVIFFTIVVFFGSFYLINLMLAVVAMSYEEEAEVMNAEKAREADEALQNKKAKEVTHECTIRTNSPKFPQDADVGCEQCKSKGDTVQGSVDKDEKDKERFLVVKAGQAGTALQSLDIHHKEPNLAPGANYQAKFNITVPIHQEGNPVSPVSSSNQHSVSEYSSSRRDSSVNDSGVVGDHDQDSLYDLAMGNVDIINCKEKERRPSKIDIPFVVSIETGNDRNCAGCQACCIDYKCWLKTQDILFTVINDPVFDFIVMLCIVLNTVFLAIEHHGMSDDLKHVLDTGNKVFTSFFLLEAILKLAALSKEYFANGWNIFDLTIVVASLLDLGLESVDGISVLRGMRLMRVLKLAQSWTTMKVLLSIIISTLGALGNLTFILLIVIYIFAVLGMQMFGMDYTKENFAPDPIPRWNFTDFFHSFMMIFRILCGEWIEPLWDCMRCQSKVGAPEACLAIFLPALVMGNFMVLNLFLALLLNSFNCEELKSRKEEVEEEEKSVFTEKIEAWKGKLKKKKSDLRVKVGLPALDSTNKFTSNGSLLSQNGIKYNSEPELQKKEDKHGTFPLTDGYRNFEEGDDEDHDIALEESELQRRSMSDRDLSICHKSKSLTFDNDNTECTDPAVHSGPEPCCPEICLKICCSCMENTWIQAKWDFFRTVVHDVVDNPFFEWTILLLIFASSLSLCFEDINLQDNEELKFILKIVNMVFAVLFTVEMFLKWIAFGLFRYFSSSWTCLDFVIVCVSVISLMVEGNSNLTAFRSLRTLRALRPLRAISRWQGMKIVVNALMYAIPSIFNVLLVCIVFWLIFSIMGVQFFGGKFYKCVDRNGERLPVDIVEDKWQCAEKNFTWINSKITFDHVGHAYLALFQVATFEGWMEIMEDAVDARDVDLQPQWEASLQNYFYFVIFIVCGSFFTLNLFIGVIIDNFNMLKKKYEGGVLEMFLTESQKHYYTAMKKLGRKKPQKVIKRPQNPYHALFYDISISRRFEIAIFVLIFLNMVSMGIEHYEQSRAVTFVLEICNALFTTIFSLEATVKIIGLRHHYFTAAWNLFDFVLVIASIVGILMEDLMTDFPVSPTLLRVVRVFRIGRILRLIKAAKGIRKLLFALIVSLPALFNIGALLALITFIYAIIGMTIFGHVKHQGAIDDLVNFETFGRSMQLLFRLVTSAGWNDVLDPLMVQPPDCDPEYKGLPNGNCGFPFVSIIYFVSFIIINFMIVINMYIAIILENFNQAHQEEEIGIVEEDLEMFYSKWSKFDPHATQFITFNQMSDFIASLDPPLGIPKPNTLAIVSFDLPIAKGDKIHCLDVLHSLTKYTLGFVEDESEDFAKLSEQMDEKFKKQFPTRKELEIVSSTREWKRLDTAARCIQKFYRQYIRNRNSDDFDQRIDIQTQTRRPPASTAQSQEIPEKVTSPRVSQSNNASRSVAEHRSQHKKSGRKSGPDDDVVVVIDHPEDGGDGTPNDADGEDYPEDQYDDEMNDYQPHVDDEEDYGHRDLRQKNEPMQRKHFDEESAAFADNNGGRYMPHQQTHKERKVQPPTRHREAPSHSAACKDSYSTHPPPHRRNHAGYDVLPSAKDDHDCYTAPRSTFPTHNNATNNRNSFHASLTGTVGAGLLKDGGKEPVSDTGYVRPQFPERHSFTEYSHSHLFEDDVCYMCDTAGQGDQNQAARSRQPPQQRIRHPAGSTGANNAGGGSSVCPRPTPLAPTVVIRQPEPVHEDGGRGGWRTSLPPSAPQSVVLRHPKGQPGPHAQAQKRPCDTIPTHYLAGQPPWAAGGGSMGRAGRGGSLPRRNLSCDITGWMGARRSDLIGGAGTSGTGRKLPQIPHQQIPMRDVIKFTYEEERVGHGRGGIHPSVWDQHQVKHRSLPRTPLEMAQLKEMAGMGLPRRPLSAHVSPLLSSRFGNPIMGLGASLDTQMPDRLQTTYLGNGGAGIMPGGGPCSLNGSNVRQQQCCGHCCCGAMANNSTGNAGPQSFPDAGTEGGARSGPHPAECSQHSHHYQKQHHHPHHHSEHQHHTAYHSKHSHHHDSHHYERDNPQADEDGSGRIREDLDPTGGGGRYQPVRDNTTTASSSSSRYDDNINVGPSASASSSARRAHGSPKHQRRGAADHQGASAAPSSSRQASGSGRDNKRSGRHQAGSSNPSKQQQAAGSSSRHHSSGGRSSSGRNKSDGGGKSSSRHHRSSRHHHQHGGGSGGRSRILRQSPVEERLSVHEDDSMSDAFDDEGLFQIDENFAKFLDDKTSCQK